MNSQTKMEDKEEATPLDEPLEPLPVITIAKQSECPSCYNVFPDVPMMVLQCKHIICMSCGWNWFVKGQRVSCPMCRDHQSGDLLCALGLHMHFEYQTAMNTAIQRMIRQIHGAPPQPPPPPPPQAHQPTPFPRQVRVMPRVPSTSGLRLPSAVIREEYWDFGRFSVRAYATGQRYRIRRAECPQCTRSYSFPYLLTHMLRIHGLRREVVFTSQMPHNCIGVLNRLE